MHIKSMSDQEIRSLYAELSDELALRLRLAEIPNKISELAQQGREIGVADSIMVEAITAEPAQ